MHIKIGYKSYNHTEQIDLPPIANTVYLRKIAT